MQTARSAQDKKIAELESAVRVAHVEVAALKKQLKEKDAARRSDEAALAQVCVRACVCVYARVVCVFASSPSAVGACCVESALCGDTNPAISHCFCAF